MVTIWNTKRQKMNNLQKTISLASFVVLILFAALITKLGLLAASVYFKGTTANCSYFDDTIIPASHTLGAMQVATLVVIILLTLGMIKNRSWKYRGIVAIVLGMALLTEIGLVDSFYSSLANCHFMG